LTTDRLKIRNFAPEFNSWEAISRELSITPAVEAFWPQVEPLQKGRKALALGTSISNDCIGLVDPGFDEFYLIFLPNEQGNKLKQILKIFDVEPTFFEVVIVPFDCCQYFNYCFLFSSEDGSFLDHLLHVL
jgi:hypothetical protein